MRTPWHETPVDISYSRLNLDLLSMLLPFLIELLHLKIQSMLNRRNNSKKNEPGGLALFVCSSCPELQFRVLTLVFPQTTPVCFVNDYQLTCLSSLAWCKWLYQKGKNKIKK